MPKYQCDLHKPPQVAGTWEVCQHSVSQEPGQNPDISNSNIETITYDATLLSNGRFVKSEGYGDRLGMLGVWKKVNDSFGWELHMADSNEDNDRFVFTVTKINKCHQVLQMDMINVESGFASGNEEQRPQVAYATWRKVDQ